MKNSRYRMLVVDDNPSIHHDFRKIFCSESSTQALDAAAAEIFGEPKAAQGSVARFELDFAHQGREGMEMVRVAAAEGRPYALVFMDVRMPPGWDGIETTARIWEIQPDLQVVICTAYADYSLHDIIAKLNFSDKFVILKKPFDIIEVQQLANAFTEKWNLLRQVQERTRNLQQSEQRYRFLSEAMPGVVWTALPDGKVDYINQQFQDYTGKTFDENKDWGWQQVVHPEDLPGTLEIWNRALATGEEYQAQFRLRRGGDGMYRWHLSRGIPMRFEKGPIIQWVGICTDIDDQKRAEELLRQNQTDLVRRVDERTEELARTRMRLEQLVQSSPVIIYSANADNPGEFTFVSRNASAALGHDPEEFCDDNQFITRQLHPDDAAKVADLRVQSRDTGHLRMEYRLRDKDGSYRWMHDESHVLYDGEGGPLEIVGYCIDITALKCAEKDRQMMEVQLRQAQKLEAIGQLAAGIAHEINTPTQYVGDNTRFLQDSFQSIQTILQSHTALLQAVKAGAVSPEMIAAADRTLAASDLEYLNAQIPTAIKETLEGVNRVTVIVRAMKEFSHPGGKEKSAADLNKAIEGTVTVARNEWKYVADVNLEFANDLPAVPCYLGEFNQVILNLVINAAHAIGDVVKRQPGAKGVITVKTLRAGDFAEIRISDTGTGIPEAVRPKIFEPFFTTKDVGKGTGQGLSIVYGSVVKKHGGTVTFESEMGKGTTFIIRLPLTASSPTPEREAKKPAAPAPAPAAVTSL